MLQSPPRKLVTMPFDPNRYTSPMPCAIDGMSMGSVRATTQASRCLTLDLARHSAAARASATDKAMPAAAEATELKAAAPKDEVENTAKAPG